MITYIIWSDSEKMGWLAKVVDCENTRVWLVVILHWKPNNV
jgi:hypothetical protein